MDLYTTFLELADIEVPKDRIIDGESLVQPLLNGTNFERLVYNIHVMLYDDMGLEFC